MVLTKFSRAIKWSNEAGKDVKRSVSVDIDRLSLDRDKMAFISGPRQCGKTTLAKSYLENLNNYFNWDDPDFRKDWSRSISTFSEKLLQQKKPTIVLDEFHKNAKWKNQLKGFYDNYNEMIRIIVTGSAHLNIYRKGADSLMGRFVHFHLHPFTLSETLEKSLYLTLNLSKEFQARMLMLL